MQGRALQEEMDEPSATVINAPPRKAWVAAILGILFGPLAMVYCGRARRAIAWLFLTLVIGLAGFAWMVYLARGQVGILIGAALILLPQIALIVDAIMLARNASPSPRRPYQRWWAYVVIAAAIWSFNSFVAGNVRSHWAEAFYIPTRSMQDTLLPGDRFIVDRLTRRWREPRHGELVAHYAHEPGSPIYMKRVLGLPGDKIEIRHEKVFRNGQQLQEPYANFEGPLPPFASMVNFGPHTIDAGDIFLLGDARRRSKDSRHDGDYPLADVIGIGRVIFWSREYTESPPKAPWQDPSPIQEWGDIRWERIGIRLD